MLNLISSGVLIAIILGILTYGMKQNIDIYATFVTGAKKGIKTTLNIFPFLLAFTVSVSVFRESGLLPLMLFRPLSGSGASAVLCDIFKVFTPDSFIGLAASVMMGSTETTLYVLNVYLSGENIKNIRYALKACLLAYLVGFIFAYIISMIFFT